MRSAAAAVVLLATSSFCLAQAPEGTPIRIRGTIERLEDSSLLVMTRNGQNVSIAIPDGLVVSGVVAKRLADIKEGDYVASTSIRDPDGKLGALEVHYSPRRLGRAGPLSALKVGHRTCRSCTAPLLSRALAPHPA